MRRRSKACHSWSCQLRAVRFRKFPPGHKVLLGGRAQEPLDASWKASLASEFCAIAASLASLSALQQSDARSSSPGAAHTKLRARTSNCHAGKSSGSPLSGLASSASHLEGFGEAPLCAPGAGALHARVGVGQLGGNLRTSLRRLNYT